MMPAEMVRYVDDLLDKIHSDPSYQLSYQQRQRLYALIDRSKHPSPLYVRGWMAILAAQKVLPIFKDAVPANDLPDALIDLGIQILQDTLSRDASIVAEHLEMAYFAGGNSWGRDEASIGRDARCAGQAADMALREVMGHRFDRKEYPPIDIPLVNQREEEFLAQISRIVESDSASTGEQLEKLLVDILRKADELPDVRHEYISSDEIVDDAVAIEKAGGDTAAAASIAFSSDGMSYECDQRRLQIFWRWWLTEALPEACRRAQTPSAC